MDCIIGSDKIHVTVSDVGVIVLSGFVRITHDHVAYTWDEVSELNKDTEISNYIKDKYPEYCI